MKISIILPVYAETDSLNDTVKSIVRYVPPEYLYEIIVVVSPRAPSESRRISEELAHRYSFLKYFYQKNNPGVGWAYREALERANGNYVLMMASDGETDPKFIPVMISKARETGYEIVAGNRWAAQGGFYGYNPVKLVLNYFFQKVLKVLFVSGADDYTYGYRLYKAAVLKSCRWEETAHPFFLESLLRPLAQGARVCQVAVAWTSRKEGKTNNSFLQNFKYIRTVLNVYGAKNAGIAEPAISSIGRRRSSI